MVWAGTAVQYRDVHPPRPFLGVGEHGAITPVHVGGLDVLKKDQGQTSRKIRAFFRHLSRFRVDALSLPGPALRPQDRGQIVNEHLSRLAVFDGVNQPLFDVFQKIEPGHAGHGNGLSLRFLPNIVPMPGWPNALALQIGHGVTRREPERVDEIRRLHRPLPARWPPRRW